MYLTFFILRNTNEDFEKNNPSLVHKMHVDVTLIVDTLKNTL